MTRRKSNRGGSVKSILLGVVAIGAMAGAGLYVMATLDAERERLRPVQDPTPATAPGTIAVEPVAPAPEGTDPLEVRSNVILETGSVPRVILGSPVCSASPMSIGQERQGLLARELVRQAFLIAARDELGATTRDVVTGEIPNVETAPTAVISSLFPRGKAAWAFVRKGSGSAADGLSENDLGAVASRDPTLPDNLAILVERAEALSRTEFPGVLRTLGLKSAAAVSWGDAPVPDGVAGRLDSMAFTEAFAVVRLLHAAIKKDGESPARLGALARAYALLGVLTEFHVHPAHKAYLARGLLYAQRLAAKRPDDPASYWNRAFVWMLVGRPTEVLADLKSASKVGGTEPKGEPPVWVTVVETAARHDVDGLGQAPAGAAALASFLRMTLLEYPVTRTLSGAAARDVLAKAPECYRAIDAICDGQALSDLHIATALGPQVLAQTLPTRLRALPDPPAELSGVLARDQGSLVPLAAALEAAGSSGTDTGELSWSALAGLIRETNFMQVFRRLLFMNHAWAVPVDEYWASVEPTVADHRYKPLLEWAAAPTQIDRSHASQKLVATFDASSAEVSQFDFARILDGSAGGRAIHAHSLVEGHLDHTSRDLGLSGRSLSLSAASEKVKSARILLVLDPNSDYARSILVDNDFESVKDKLDEWARKPNLAPELAVALGRRFEERKNQDRAVELYERAAQLAPDRETIDKLASVYVKKGMKDKWRKILDDFITNGPDSGLDHAHFQVQIADQLMSEAKYDEAWPYAEAAAKTWAAWALICAANCAEWRADWEAAEGYSQALSQRYPNFWWKWIMYCKRSGHGNTTSAVAFTEEALKSIGDRPDLVIPSDQAHFRWIIGEYKRASTEFEQIHASQKAPEELFRAVMTADAAGDSARRDTLYKQFREAHGAFAPKTIVIWDQMLAGIDKIKTGTFDWKPIDEIIQSIKPETRWYTEFIVGQFIRIHGKPGDALKYHTSCSRSRWVSGWVQAMANDSARAGTSDLKSAFRLRARSAPVGRAAVLASFPRA